MSTQETLQFIVMVDGSCDRERAVRTILDAFNDAVPLKAHSCDLRANWIEVWANDDADPHRSNDPKDGYLHYKTRVDVTPMGDVSEIHQIQLARDLKASFEAVGCKAVVCANFEDQL